MSTLIPSEKQHLVILIANSLLHHLGNGSRFQTLKLETPDSAPGLGRFCKKETELLINIYIYLFVVIYVYELFICVNIV